MMILHVFMYAVPIFVFWEIVQSRWWRRRPPAPSAKPGLPYRDAGVCPHCQGSGHTRQP